MKGYEKDMAEKFEVMSSNIVDAIGGTDNVESLSHCMTRLRFILKDESKADDATVKEISGVMGLVKQGGQYQVIVGNNVAKAYSEILKLGVSGMQDTNGNENKPKEKFTLKKLGANILDAIIGTMSPLIPAIIGGSMIKLLAMVLLMVGVFTETNSTYIILNTIGDAAFFFLPLLVAVSASKKFGSNTYLALAIGGLLVHPAFMDLMAQAAEGKTVMFTFITMTSVKYTYTIIPTMVMAWLLKYIDDFADKITPVVTKNFLKPMLIMLIAAPIAILLVGPAGIWLGTGISDVVYGVHDKLGWLAVAIVGAIWPLLVMTGMHRVFTPTIVTTIAEVGKEGMVMPSEIGANMGLGGVSLAVAVKTKNSELRQTALAAASSAIIAGISEPALYGVAVRLKRPMIASVITGFVSGAIAGMGGLASHSMAAPGLFTSVQFIDKDNPMSIVWIVAAMVVAVVLSFVLTLVLGFEDIPEPVNEKLEATETNNEAARVAFPGNIISVPLAGQVMPLSELDDAVFSTEMMGKGLAIRPESGHVVSPVSGTVTTVFPTKHAYGITSDTGIEVLVHIGLDTVSLNGAPFEAHVETGHKIERGDKLATVDLQAIHDAGLSTDTVIVVTNAGDYKDVNVTDAKNVAIDEHLIEIVG